MNLSIDNSVTDAYGEIEFNFAGYEALKAKVRLCV